MPNINDYDKSEEDNGAPTSVSSGSPGSTVSSGGGMAPSGASPQHEETFTPWSRFVNANKEVSDREAGKLQSSVQNDVNAATSGREGAAKAQQQGVESNYSQGSSFAPAAFGGSSSGFGRKAAPGAGTQGGLTNDALNAPKGSQDLESQLGPDAWAKLLGQTGKAGAEANALGSETGVQGLIQERAAKPLAQGGAFDAALESQAGAPGFQALNKQYGDNQLFGQLAQADTAAQGRWQKLMGDENAGRAAASAAQAAAPEGSKAASVEPAAMGIEDILTGGGDSGFSNLHQLGLSLSPADQADIELADATNTDLPLATEAFSKAEGGAIAGGTGIENSWGPARVRMAYDKVSHEFDSQAMADFRSALQKNPEMLKQYMAMKNPGYMAHQMRQWLISTGHKQHGAQHNTQPQTQQFGGGQQGVSYMAPSGQQRQTTSQQEADRTYAYRQGWGQQWDEQFNNGNDNPSRG
jgi:hypothetical protein